MEREARNEETAMTIEKVYTCWADNGFRITVKKEGREEELEKLRNKYMQDKAEREQEEDCDDYNELMMMFRVIEDTLVEEKEYIEHSDKLKEQQYLKAYRDGYYRETHRLIKVLMDKMQITESEAMDMLEISGEKRKEYNDWVEEKINART